MRKTWKKILATCCAILMLVTLPGMYILADELKEDIFIDEICEAADVPDDITDIGQAEAPNVSDSLPNTPDQQNESIQFQLKTKLMIVMIKLTYQNTMSQMSTLLIMLKKLLGQAMIILIKIILMNINIVYLKLQIPGSLSIDSVPPSLPGALTAEMVCTLQINILAQTAGVTQKHGVQWPLI